MSPSSVDHPGGQQSILKHAGKDATAAYDPIHPAGTLEKYLDVSKHLGSSEQVLTKTRQPSVPPSKPQDIRQQQEEPKHPPHPTEKPPLSHCLNLSDFESVARQVLDPTSWAYFSSAADDEITLQENYRAFHRVWFRPRVMVNVKEIDTSTTLLGARSSLPFYITATALNKLAHPDGEVAFTRAAGTHGIAHMIPTLSSCAWDDIVDARRGEDQVQRMQLYVNEDRDVTKQIVQQAEKRGCKGLFITVDNPQVGRREKDLRARQRAASRDGEAWHPEVYQGTSTFLDSTLCWDDVPLFPEHHQRAHRAQGHPERRGRPPDRGARRRRRRALEPRRAAARVRAAVARGPRRDDAGAARARGLQDGIDVFVDGGVRRGTDILKALCLGARGVGIGRGLLYPLGAYGQPGVEGAIQLLREELERGMRLLDVRNVGELHAGLVTVDSLARHAGCHIDGPRETLSEPLEVIAPGGKSKL